MKNFEDHVENFVKIRKKIVKVWQKNVCKSWRLEEILKTLRGYGQMNFT